MIVSHEKKVCDTTKSRIHEQLGLCANSRMVVVSDRKSHITAQHKSQCSLHDSRRARSAAPPRDNLVKMRSRSIEQTQTISKRDLIFNVKSLWENTGDKKIDCNALFHTYTLELLCKICLYIYAAISYLRSRLGTC